MNGVVAGGWEFVWAAYGVTGLALLAYVWRVIAGYYAARAEMEKHP